MAAPRLFAPLRLRQLVLPNRIVIAPMCQYSARDGQMTDWHLIHVGQLAQSGSGLLIVEATAVEPRGRITHRCAGLYDDASEAAMARVVHAANKHGNTPIAIQLGHAGRKASTHPPHHGGRPLSADEQPWETIAPSAIPFGDDGWHCPAEMDRAMMDDVIAYVRFDAAARAPWQADPPRAANRAATPRMGGARGGGWQSAKDEM